MTSPAIKRPAEDCPFPPHPCLAPMTCIWPPCPPLVRRGKAINAKALLWAQAAYGHTLGYFGHKHVGLYGDGNLFLLGKNAERAAFCGTIASLTRIVRIGSGIPSQHSLLTTSHNLTHSLLTTSHTDDKITQLEFIK